MKNIFFIAASVLVLASGTALSQHEPQAFTQSSKQDKSQNMKQNHTRVNGADQHFVTEAADAGMAKVAHGQMAVTRATNADVRSFAQRMIDDHTQANQELMQLASTKGITLPNAQSQAWNSSGNSTNINSNQNNSGQNSSNQNKTGQNNSSQRNSDQGNAGRNTSGQNSSGQHSTDHHNSMGMEMSDQQKQLKGKHREMMDRMMKISGSDFDREYMQNQVKEHEKAVMLFERQANSGTDAELKAFAAKNLPTLREHHQMAKEIAAKVGSNEVKSSNGSSSRPKK